MSLAPLDVRLADELRSTFGYGAFRPLQAEITRAIMQGKDVFVLMPTGGGKSLCYQLPALLMPGPTVVVSPLIALMKDQVDALLALGVKATFVNSSLPQHEVARRQRALAENEYSLIYVAPERLMMPEFLRELQKAMPSLFAVDEAHCISEWGHDFRPEYRQLSRLRVEFPGVPFAAFTATATPRVQSDIVSQLTLRSADIFHGSFNRPNLYYDVRPAARKYEQLIHYLQSHRDSSGIVYCFSRAGTEELATRLQQDGVRATAYHAGLEPGERQRRQDAFVRDDVEVIVATVAFGMGIDKPDVRFVVHFDLPKSLEGYYQESGRAGRDGEPADCILFFNRGDIVKQRRFLDEKPEDERRVAEWQLRQLADWADGPACRRRVLLAYFGDELQDQVGPCCDACSFPADMEDYTIEAQKLLSCVKRTGERFGLSHVVDVLRGADTTRVTSRRHHQLSTYGIGRDRSDGEWRHIGRQLVRAGWLAETSDTFAILSVTEQGRQVLFDNAKVTLPAWGGTVDRAKRDGGGEEQVSHPELFERLRVVRKRLADERGVPPYVIFHDSTLKHMCGMLPVTKDDLLRLPGVGKRKAEDFGAAVLREVTTYLEAAGVDREVAVLASSPARQPRSRGRVGESERTSIHLFLEGLDPASIASRRNLSPSTVESHLAAGIESGDVVEIDRLVEPSRRQVIERAMEELDTRYLGPLREHLGHSFSYAELRYARSWLMARDGERPL